MGCKHVLLASVTFMDRKYFIMLVAFSACHVIGYEV